METVVGLPSLQSFPMLCSRIAVRRSIGMTSILCCAILLEWIMYSQSTNFAILFWLDSSQLFIATNQYLWYAIMWLSYLDESSGEFHLQFAEFCWKASFSSPIAWPASSSPENNNIFLRYFTQEPPHIPYMYHFLILFTSLLQIGFICPFIPNL